MKGAGAQKGLQAKEKGGAEGGMEGRDALGTPKGSGMAEGARAPGGCRAGVAQRHGVELYSESSGATGRSAVRQDRFDQLDWRGLRADVGSCAIAVCWVESVCTRMVAVKVRDEQSRCRG